MNMNMHLTVKIEDQSKSELALSKTIE